MFRGRASDTVSLSSLLKVTELEGKSEPWQDAFRACTLNQIPYCLLLYSRRSTEFLTATLALPSLSHLSSLSLGPGQPLTFAWAHGFRIKCKLSSIKPFFGIIDYGCNYFNDSKCCDYAKWSNLVKCGAYKEITKLHNCSTMMRLQGSLLN